MQRGLLQFLTLIVAMSFASFASAQANTINLTFDSAKAKPTIVTQITKGMANSPVVFRSINYANPGDPAPFSIVFENFVGEYNKGFGNGTTCFDNQPVLGDVTCPSEAAGTVNIPPGNNPHEVQEVRVQLTNQTPDGSPGFAYTISMGGGVYTFDPRIRGN